MGEIVKINGTIGILKDIYLSPTSGNYVIFFYGPKNAFKSQTGDIIPLSSGEMMRIKPATKKDLEDEIQFYKGLAISNIQDNLGQILNEK